VQEGDSLAVLAYLLVNTEWLLEEL